MKLDDRDITCETDYTPLSNAELVEAIEQHVAIMYTSPIIDFDLEWIIGPARALLARAEAAEALAYERLENMLFAEQRANDAANDATDAELHLRRAEQAAEQLTAENRRLTARVAELEARESAAWQNLSNQWRSVLTRRNDELAAANRRIAELVAQLAAQGWRPVTAEWPEEGELVELLVNGYRDGGNWYYNDDNEPLRGWRPLPAPPPPGADSFVSVARQQKPPRS